MPKVWNIGNTTVRNPKRIEKALKIFVEEGFSGNAKGAQIEARLHGKLKEREVLEFDGSPSSWNGRKWRAAFYQLGFISFERYRIGETNTTKELFSKIELPDIKATYQITPAGIKLINALSIPEIEEIYTRQFVCHELPNSLEKGFNNGSMKPFILLLQVLHLLKVKGEEGLDKFETGLFIQKFRNHTPELPQQIFDEILEYRRLLKNCKSVKERKALKNKYKENLGKDVGINPNSVVKDYADTTFRYFSLSGLLARVGQTIIIRENRKNIVDEILRNEPKFLFKQEPIQYFKFFYNNSYPLPTDNKTFALQEIAILKNGIRSSSNPLLNQANTLDSDSDLTDIQQTRIELIKYNNWEREEDFANEQRSENAIRDIIKYLRVLNGESVINGPEIDDKPAYLEWAVWRSFLSIDELISPPHKSRRFPVDQDFYPRNTAPGGGSDLLFEFDSYILIVEVTLTTSHRQMAVESEPVRRHTVQYKEEFLEKNKDIYCLFIAPKVDNNVAESFRIGVWYKGDDEEFVNIVPMSLSDFISTIEVLLSIKFTNSDFRRLIDRCLVFRNVRAPQWKIAITNEIKTWKQRLLKGTE